MLPILGGTEQVRSMRKGLILKKTNFSPLKNFLKYRTGAEVAKAACRNGIALSRWGRTSGKKWWGGSLVPPRE